MDSKNTTIELILRLVGGFLLLSHRKTWCVKPLRLRPRPGNIKIHGQQEVGTGKPQVGVTIREFVLSQVISVPGRNFPKTEGVSTEKHLSHAMFDRVQFFRSLCASCSHAQSLYHASHDAWLQCKELSASRTDRSIFMT